MKLVIVSGLSGSGKSVALHALEDHGYYCVDNLLIGLLPAFVHELVSAGDKIYDKVAFGIDARSGIAELEHFPEIVEQIRTTGVDPQIIFLQAETSTLIKRYNETRRKHPLTDKNVSLIEAINLERSLLATVLEHADLSIETTQTNLYQLRSLIQDYVVQSDMVPLYLTLQSFGYKHGIPTDSDFVFDVRCLPNPHWEPALRGRTGLDEDVINYLKSHIQVEDMFKSLRGFLDNWLPIFEKESRSFLNVSVGCTGGQHRSVYIIERLAEHYRKSKRENLTIRHRELS